MNSVLSKLGISEFNFGACSGKDQWSKTKDDGLIESINPSNNELIASVYQSTENDYNNVELIIYDINGRLIETLISNNLEYGRHEVIWNANNISTGIYLI